MYCRDTRAPEPIVTEQSTRCPEPDDATLVAEVRQGQTTAFERLYERHRLPLYRTALAVTRDRAAAEELLQEAFLRAYRHVARIELAEGASLRPWLHRILVNLAYDWSARQRKHAASPLEGVVDKLVASPNLSPERHAAQSELQTIVADAIDQLPFKQQIVIILFYLHDMDLGEISAIVNVPPGTVKSRLYYGRARMRELLQDDERLPAQGVLRYVSS
jgi:RNA polymerase sigma-70 factor (ECF subfamily)